MVFELKILNFYDEAKANGYDWLYALLLIVLKRVIGLYTSRIE